MSALISPALLRELIKTGGLSDAALLSDVVSRSVTSGLGAIIVAEIGTSLVLSSQTKLALQTAFNTEVQRQSRVRSAVHCFAGTSSNCPGVGHAKWGKGKRWNPELTVPNAIEACKGELKKANVESSFGYTFVERPFVRAWFRGMEHYFNACERAVVENCRCKNEQEHVCRKRVPAIVKKCVEPTSKPAF